MADSQQKLMRDAVKQIKKLKQDLARYKKVRHEPIAVIGMGCRYPNGANNPDLFWQKLVNSEDCINQQDNNERWDMDKFYDPNPDAAGRINAKGLGLIDNVDEFDADFFGISPREAEDIDPQHRLLLEVSYETIENAGYAPASLAGTNTGVYLGMASSDYAHLGSILGSPEDITPWQGIGNAMSAAPGRLAYLFNLKGPALALDTACSSSLVALHSACNALRHHDCDQALAGGVHLVLNPAVSIVFSKARMLAPDGLCKTFDASADGYVRSEGCGMLMLKRLSDAEADGDNILALIKGSAINQDGKSQGITAPNETAQMSVIQQAIKHAGLKPQDISYVEAHGTGTPLGDPIEINALNAVYGKGRTQDSPLLVGSVKTNIGHAEAASGVAGVIKLIQSMRHHQLPEHLHFKTPNPYIQWDSMPIEITSKSREWVSKDSNEEPLRAGVSAFAFTGTNAHVILEEYDTTAERDHAEPDTEQKKWIPKLVLASAQKQQALSDYQQQLSQSLNQHDSVDIDDLAYASAVYKDNFKYRKAWLPKSIESIKESLSGNNVAGSNVCTTMEGEKPKGALKTAFLFSGAQSYRQGMAETLYQHVPEFKKQFDAVLAGFPEEIANDLSSKNSFAAVFVVEVALAKTWIAWGLKPDCMMGLGVGEVAAAYIAELCSLHDACELVLVLAAFANNRGSTEGVAAAIARLNNIQFSTPKVRVLSSFTGKYLGGEMACADYWVRHTKEVHCLSDCVNELIVQKISVALEIGLGSSLAADVSNIYQKNDTDLVAVTSLPAHSSELDGLEMSLATLFVAGIDLRWQHVFSTKHGLPSPRISNPLPTYPFQRKVCWSNVLKQNINKISKSTFECLYQLSWKVNHSESLHADSFNIDPGEDEKAGIKWLLLFPTSFFAQEFSSFIKRSSHGDVEKIIYELNDECFPTEDKLLALTNGAEQCNIVFSTAQLSKGAIKQERYSQLFGALLLLAKVVRKTPGLNLYLITENAVALKSDSRIAVDRDIDPLQAMLHGAAKSLALELPDKLKLSVDIDSNQFDSVKACANLLQKGCQSPWVAIRDGKYYSPKLVKQRQDITRPKSNLKSTFNANGLYLVAGGTGTIGISIAKWLIEQGVRHIALLSRSGLTSENAIQAVEDMRSNGAQILAPKVDIADRNALSELLQTLRKRRHINGVVHAAGVFELSPIQDLTLSQCEKVMASKVLGIQWLDQLTQGDSIECFIGFSSIASVWGSAGNFHYAAANQVVNSVIATRRAANKPGLVVNWGPWADSGMVTNQSKQLAEKRGLKTLSHDAAMQAFEYLVNVDMNECVVADIQWDIFKSLMNLTVTGNVFDSIVIDTQQGTQASGSAIEQNEEDLAFKEKISQCDEVERESLLLSYLSLQLSRSLQIDPEELDESKPMIDMGIDSLMAVEFKNRVMLITNSELPLVRLLNGASLKDVAAYLVSDQVSVAPAEDETDEMVEGVL